MQESQAAAVVRARILASKCVQDIVMIARTALGRLEAAAAKKPRRDEQPEAPEEHPEPDSAALPKSPARLAALCRGYSGLQVPASTMKTK